MQDVTCSYSTHFGATFVATLPNVVRVSPNCVRVFPNSVRIFPNSGSIFPNGVRIFSNGGSIFSKGGSIFSNGGSIFPNGGSIFRSSLLSACSYKSSSKKSGVATGNGLFVSPFSAKVAPVARFFTRIIRAREHLPSLCCCLLSRSDFYSSCIVAVVDEKLEVLERVLHHQCVLLLRLAVGGSAA